MKKTTPEAETAPAAPPVTTPAPPAQTPNTNPFRAIRRAAVPLCAYETSDPASCIRNCLATLNGKLVETAVAQWDILNGLRGMNEPGKAFQAEICGQDDPAISTGNPAECLKKLAEKTPNKAIVFWHLAHRFIENEAVSQGLWNLRDIYKGKGATLVMLAPALTLPPELKQDVVIISEPLPDETQLGKIIDSVVKDAGESLNDAARISVANDKPFYIDTLRGLSGFAAEQVVAMSISKSGIDSAGLWERKRKMIEQTPGLAVWQGGETFNDLGGLENLKSFLSRIFKSSVTPVRAILYVDEIEKSLGNTSGDSSNTSQDQLGVILKVMQDENLPGIILIGHAGCGKSAIAKASGNMGNCPVVACDLGAMKSGLVGSSEARIRAAMDVFKAVSQGKGIVIATCNRIAGMPPELRRRFTLGTFMVDLPDHVERISIWALWIKRFGLDASQPLPPSDSWTGAEVKACCDVAFRTGLPLTEAAQFIVPVIKAAPDQVDQLRKLATGRFISASYPGAYQWPPKEHATATDNRKMDL